MSLPGNVYSAHTRAHAAFSVWGMAFMRAVTVQSVISHSTQYIIDSMGSFLSKLYDLLNNDITAYLNIYNHSVETICLFMF